MTTEQQNERIIAGGVLFAAICVGFLALSMAAYIIDRILMQL